MSGDLVTPHPKPAPRPEKRRKRVNPVSAKRRRDYERRDEVRRIVEARDGWRCWAHLIGWPGTCDTRGPRQDLELHETTPRGRDPQAWLDPDKCRLVCPAAHDELTSTYGETLALARSLGLDVKAAPLPPLPTFDREDHR